MSKKTDNGANLQKWIAVIGSAVSICSLLLNVVLAVNNQRLARSKQVLDEKLGKLELELRTAELDKSKREKEEQILQQQVNRYENSVDIQQKFLIFSNWRDFEKLVESPPKGTYHNQVYRDFCQWLPTRNVGVYELSDTQNKAQLTFRQHALILFHIRNRGKILARDISLTVYQKKFPQNLVKIDEYESLRMNMKYKDLGAKDRKIWELDCTDWETREFDLGDLSPGQEKFVPLMHVAGIDHYIGTAYIPKQLSWKNPITGLEENVTANKMLAIDQWQAEGLVFTSQ